MFCTNCPKQHNIHVEPRQTDQLQVLLSPFIVFCLTTCPVFNFGMSFQVIKHFYISMSSSPGKLHREECVSAGGLEGLRGLWGLGDGHGVWGCRDTVCCLRCFCNGPFRFRQKGSSGGRHNTNSMQEWLLKVWGRRRWGLCTKFHNDWDVLNSLMFTCEKTSDYARI